MEIRRHAYSTIMLATLLSGCETTVAIQYQTPTGDSTKSLEAAKDGFTYFETAKYYVLVSKSPSDSTNVTNNNGNGTNSNLNSPQPKNATVDSPKITPALYREYDGGVVPASGLLLIADNRHDKNRAGAPGGRESDRGSLCSRSIRKRISAFGLE